MGENDGVIRIESFDGQSVWVDRNTALFEVGHFLGGGAAGTVYECEHVKSREHYALKILNPIGYKLISPPLLRRCTVMSKGKIVTDAVEKMKNGLTKENVWWLINASSKQYYAAYFSERQNSLREFTLMQCIQIWGSDPSSVGDEEFGDSMVEIMQTVNGPKIQVPDVAPKYAEFVRKRRKIFREIKHMRKISNHVNVIRLESVLELTQESKCTIFLVMELANGGELFDRIKIDCGTREDTAKFFFTQLLRGVKHCHDQGVCHRDLKPENLLLQDTHDQTTILKIADFGFSALFAMTAEMESAYSAAAQTLGEDWCAARQTVCRPPASELRRLTSVVGSPFYVAPEVLQSRGYDGPKADIWSLGVILYAMLAGNLPFDQELTTCKRFKLYCKWIRERPAVPAEASEEDVEYPQWLFPSKFSALAKDLIVSMLQPDPDLRISVGDSMRHPLLRIDVPPSPPMLSASSGCAALAIARMGFIYAPSPMSSPSPSLPVATDVVPVLATFTHSSESSFTALGRGEQPSLIRQLEGLQSSSSEYLCNDDFKTAMTIEESISVVSLDKTKEGTHVAVDPHNTSDSFSSNIPIGSKVTDATSANDDDNDEVDCQFAMEEDISRHDEPQSVGHSHTDVQHTGGHDYASIITDDFYLIPPSSSSSYPVATEVPSYVDAKAESLAEYNVAESPSSPSFFRQRRISEAGITLPPPAPHPPSCTNFDDLIVNGDEEGLLHAPSGLIYPVIQSSASARSGSKNSPPSFSDIVKRSSRFVTAVPAADVLLKVEQVLEQYRLNRTQTPIGLIGKVSLQWETFRLEVWGADNVTGPALCALQLYQIPSTAASYYTGQSPAPSPARLFSTSPSTSSTRPPEPLERYPATRAVLTFKDTSPILSSHSTANNVGQQMQQLFLVEFVRGQLEIFAFKRFYEWVRHRLSELVKKDYAFKLFDQASPMVEPTLIQRMQSENLF